MEDITLDELINKYITIKTNNGFRSIVFDGEGFYIFGKENIIRKTIEDITNNNYNEEQIQFDEPTNSFVIYTDNVNHIVNVFLQDGGLQNFLEILLKQKWNQIQ